MAQLKTCLIRASWGLGLGLDGQIWAALKLTACQLKISERFDIWFIYFGD